LSREPRSTPGAPEVAAAALFLLAATVVLTWPQAAHLSDGLADVGDAKLVTRILQWDYAQTLRDPLNLFQINFFHPARDVLAFSENLWGVSLFGFPLLAAGAAPLTNYNVILLLGMFLSALAAWALARHVTGDGAASLAAGLVFAFVPWRFSQLSHLQFQWAAFLALMLLFLVRYLERGRPRDATLLGAAFAWNAWCNIHYALFGGILVALTLGLAALQGLGDARRRRNALFATIAGGLAFLPFAVPYHRAEVVYGMKRYTSEIMFFSGRLHDFLSAGPRSRLYGEATAAWRSPEGDFFPGIAAVLFAAVALATIRRPADGGAPPALSRARLRAARLLDGVAAVLGVVWIAARLSPGLRLGPLTVGDPGRVQVVLTLAVLARLVLALPGRSRYASLGDFLRRGPFPGALVLFAAIAVTGALVALGGNTPYYRFLFQTFGRIFRSIRVPARGIVLFHLALAVLAAWGLSRLTRRRRTAARAAGVATALAVLLVEYHGSPLELDPVSSAAPPVYQWLASADVPAAVVEWPLGILYDFDYVFRQAQHGRPIVNGYSGFFPAPYIELANELRLRPIPDTVWRRMGDLGGGLLIYHAHEGRGFRAEAYADALDRALGTGSVEIVRVFEHDGGRDFVLVAAGTPWRDRVADASTPEERSRQYADATALLRREIARLAPPFGNLHRPAEMEFVSPGFWAHGWALDDSGMEAVEVEVDGAPRGKAVLGGAWPGLAAAYPDYPEAKSGGAYGFPIPELSPGIHTLIVTFRGKDGGTHRIERRVRVSVASATRRGPGS